MQNTDLMHFPIALRTQYESKTIKTFVGFGNSPLIFIMVVTFFSQFETRFFGLTVVQESRGAKIGRKDLEIRE